MIIMPVPKDIRSFEPKFIGPFSKRQTYAVGIAVIFGTGVYAVCNAIGLQEMASTIVVIVDSPIAACGFIDIFGMPLWVYAKEVMINKLFAPKHRPYATENTYAGLAVQNMITYEYFDGSMDEYSTKQMRKKQKEKEKRLEQFYKREPDMRPIA